MLLEIGVLNFSNESFKKCIAKLEEQIQISKTNEGLNDKLKDKDVDGSHDTKSNINEKLNQHAQNVMKNINDIQQK